MALELNRAGAVKQTPGPKTVKLLFLSIERTVLGTVVGSTVGGQLIGATGKWESAFYLFGISGILWFILWVLLCYSSPETHPFISEKEKDFLRREVGRY